MIQKIKAYGLCVYKKEKDAIKILLCKSSISFEKWGLLKGVEEKFESKKQTAIREFYEESSIKVEEIYLENYYEQQNSTKDIGIFLVNFDNIDKIKSFFINDKLLNRFLSPENSQVRFFNIDNLPKIKKKQKHMVSQIIRDLKKD